MESSSVSLPDAFAQVVADAIPGILAHQQPDGAIVYDPAAPIVYPQQAILPLAFCYAGLSPDKHFKDSPELRQAILKIGDWLVAHFDDHGCMHFDSHGYDVRGVDQRLTAAWLEALVILQKAQADFPFEIWADKILRAADYLAENHLRCLQGLRHFTMLALAMSTNHIALYISTVYRAGQILNRPDLCAAALPLARALAADVHPDGYWAEHDDLLGNGGPTPSYNYLTHCAIALMYEWTGEKVFADALEKSTAFHGNFCYPDGTFLELIDERVRHDRIPEPRVWGLFGFSHSPAGRGTARAHFATWRANIRDLARIEPESLARHCENFLYWHPGPIEPAPFENPTHQASLTLPATIFTRGPWTVALSALPALNAQDPSYRQSAFALEHQKLLSVWHRRVGLILDGSHSKNQPENSTFSAPTHYFGKTPDYYPIGGSVSMDGSDRLLRAIYKTFRAHIRVRPLADPTLEIELAIDPAGNCGPFTANFTLCRIAEAVSSGNGRQWPLGEEPFSLTGADLGGTLTYGPLKISGPDQLCVSWPFSPFNSYATSGKSPPEASQLRVHFELTPERPSTAFRLTVE